MSTDYTPLGIPPRTRIYHIVRHHYVGGSGGYWAVWIAVSDMQQNYGDWLGTYLALHDDGGVTRVTIDPDGMERIMEVMPRGR